MKFISLTQKSEVVSHPLHMWQPRAMKLLGTSAACSSAVSKVSLVHMVQDSPNHSQTFCITGRGKEYILSFTGQNLHLAKPCPALFHMVMCPAKIWGLLLQKRRKNDTGAQSSVSAREMHGKKKLSLVICLTFYNVEYACTISLYSDYC